MSNAYIDERLLDVVGLSDFPELHEYIKEHYPKPNGELPQPVLIGDQTLQQQVKNNDDIIYASNEVFEPPVPNAITKFDLGSQLERQSFLASSGSNPQLIAYDDRTTLTASYEATGLFPNRYLFKSYPSNTKYIPVHVEQQEFFAMCLFKDMNDNSSAHQMKPHLKNPNLTSTKNELATTKPLPIVQQKRPKAASIGLANGFMNGLQTPQLAHQGSFPIFFTNCVIL
ncbi:MAG: hypothetical protein EZS28_013526 [Streblomastix strix]|uniref:Uncharacterized protein n=1 Tax=Streblomastix strix TaxID=222440 RepID=A0A5J4W7U9_9EUKA|nr:MAG: hypothetical protein EZS28_013526 [Streblomastix strix]